MCGIAGIIKLKDTARAEISPDLLKRMSDVITHRGPDSDGAYISADGKMGMSFRRLAIIDLSELGNQPMHTTDGRYSIVFNGEIYNHRVIRQDLEKLGARYKSQTDTETILNGYAYYGIDILQKMLGMWAFAIYDNQEKSMLLARDRIGIKPLYYTVTGDTLIFGSEIKSILEHPLVKREINFQELPNYLNFGSTSSNATLFAGIRKLPAGNYLKISSDGEIEQVRYWSAFEQGSDYHKLNQSELQSEIMRLLRTAIKDRMMSDVPFGVFLSGGIDSSLNVALMSELMDRPVDTFTVGFRELEKYNELQYARQIADLFKTNHNEILIDHNDAIGVMDRLAFHQDEPNADPVCIPIYFLSKMTRERGTTVIQVGEGSDEQFVGYNWMRREYNFHRKVWSKFNALPTAIKKSLYYAVKPLFNYSGQYSALDYIRRSAYGEELYWSGLSVLSPEHLSKLFTKDYAGLSAIPAVYAMSLYDEIDSIAPGADYLQKMSQLELKQRLAEMLLMRVDKMTMAHSLEARVPFLDSRLVEFLMKIPPQYKVGKNIHTKHLLKKAAEGILPDNIIYRKKMGFAAPISEWLRTHWFDYAKNEILNSYFVKENIFNPSFINSMLYKHKNGDKNFSKEIYSLLMLSLWHKRYF